MCFLERRQPSQHDESLPALIALSRTVICWSMCIYVVLTAFFLSFSSLQMTFRWEQRAAGRPVNSFSVEGECDIAQDKNLKLSTMHVYLHRAVQMLDKDLTFINPDIHSLQSSLKCRQKYEL